MASAKLLHGAMIIIFVWLQHPLMSVTSSEFVYFDNFGHCQGMQPFDLADEKYILRHIGGGFPHETLICDMTFKSPPGYGICLTFDEFEITDCTVWLKIFSSTSSSGTPWRVLGCADSTPGHMCTTNRHLTVQVIKDKLNYNRGYTFKIHVEKSNSITEKGVLFASIGVFVAVILGVVIFIAFVALSVLYCCCCCRGNPNPKLKASETSETASHTDRTLVQPSAPPIDTSDHNWDAAPGDHISSRSFYKFYQSQHSPPPYVPPPPYQLNNPIPESLPATVPSQSFPVKK